MIKSQTKHFHYKSTQLLMILGSIFLGFSSTAQAVDWSNVIKNHDSNIAVDMDSYDEAKGYPSIITRTRFTQPQTIDVNAKKVIYIEQRAMPQFNCSTHQIKTSRIDIFDKHGKKVATDVSKNQFTPITAGSIDAQLESLVCQVHKMVGGM